MELVEAAGAAAFDCPYNKAEGHSEEHVEAAVCDYLFKIGFGVHIIRIQPYLVD